MTLVVKDGNGTLRSLKTTESLGEHTTHHIIDSIASTPSVGVVTFDADGISLPSTINNLYGQTSVSSSSTAVKIQTTATSVRTGVIVKALAGNSEKVYVGDSNVTTSNGFELSAGETVIVPIDDISKIYIIGQSATTVSVSYMGS